MSLTPHFPDLGSTGIPGRLHCSADYGQNILHSVCTNIYQTHWPFQSGPIRLYLREPAPSDAIWLPYSVTEPGCTLAIEPAGPGASDTHYVTVYPTMLMGRARLLIERCPEDDHGLGGFITYGFRHAIGDFFAPWGRGPGFSDQDSLARGQLSGFFLTISVYGDGIHESQPGDTDPIIGGAVARFASNNYDSWDFRNTGRGVMGQLAEFFRSRAIDMIRGGSRTWWDGVLDHRIEKELEHEEPDATDSDKTATNDTDPQEHGDMTYQCDSGLGAAPKPIDCEKLSWSGLKSPDSVETLQAHVPKVYSQGTCALAISSASTTTITWAHLLAAFDTLYNLCVRNPISSARGGRAYFGQQAFSSWINGKRDSVAGVNGSEALPVGINATLFNHDPKSNLSCELNLAHERKNIALCKAD